MTVTHKEILRFLDGKPIDDELRERLRQEWENPDSLLQRLVQERVEIEERTHRGDVTWMDIEAIIKSSD